MMLHEMYRKTRNRVADWYRRFAKLEYTIATACFFAPAIMIYFNDGKILKDISSYYGMAQNQWYYFPLTVASMLFIVNGVVKEKHVYNTILGLLLAGVILLNEKDWEVQHFIFAGGVLPREHLRDPQIFTAAAKDKVRPGRGDRDCHGRFLRV